MIVLHEHARQHAVEETFELLVRALFVLLVQDVEEFVEVRLNDVQLIHAVEA